MYKIWLNIKKMRLNLYKIWLNKNKMRLNMCKIWLNINKMRLNVSKVRLNIYKIWLNKYDETEYENLRLNTNTKMDWIIHWSLSFVATNI